MTKDIILLSLVVQSTTQSNKSVQRWQQHGSVGRLGFRSGAKAWIEQTSTRSGTATKAVMITVSRSTRA